MTNSILYKEIIDDLIVMAHEIHPAKDMHDHARMTLPTHKLANYIHHKVEQTIEAIALGEGREESEAHYREKLGVNFIPNENQPKCSP